MNKKVNIKAVIWDLDNTLYPFNKDFELTCNRSAAQTILDLGYGSDFDEAHRISTESYEKYGYSAAQLVDHYQVPYPEYHHAYHKIIDETVIDQNEPVRQGLINLNIPQAIVTHASRDWAERILQHLGLKDLFPDEKIIPLEDVNYESKGASEKPFRHALEQVGISDIDCVLMVEDVPKNLKIPKKIGLQTALIHHGQTPEEDHDFIDHHFADTLSVIESVMVKS